jgi:small-conductance mechanosensitive channel
MSATLSWQSLPLFTNSLAEWVIALLIAAGVLTVLLAARSVVRRHHARLAATPQMEVLEIPTLVLGSTSTALLAMAALFTGAQWLTMGPASTKVLQSAITIAFSWQAGAWAVAIVRIWLDRKRARDAGVDRAALGSLGIIKFILNVVIWAVVVLLTLDNLGIDITALIAGLGIGGIAVALAVQNVLGDLFASLSITLDRPFVVGDFLVVGDALGTVEHIGVKSTRLRSLNGEQIIVANSDLLGSRIRNYGRMSERRVVFATGITYETPLPLIERVPGIIRDIIESQQDVRFDRSHFAAHGSSSLEFETVYYVLSADYNKYMDIHQAICLQLHRAFNKAGIEFAYPTQRLLLEGTVLPRPLEHGMGR